MDKISFSVSARAGKLLGRENFSNPAGAIIELVKNSYDADARNCIVIFDITHKTIVNTKKKTKVKVIDDDKSHIYMIDNGDGMTEAVITNQWMKIGTGNKESDYISGEKRIKTGAKGIGRFALDRLGGMTRMWTLSEDAEINQGVYWKMDWAQFDNSDKLISDINAQITQKNISLKDMLLKKFSDNPELIERLSKITLSNGTILKMSKLKDFWSGTDINHIFNDLEALIPPKELMIPFEVDFFYLQEPQKYGKVETAFFNDFDYKVIAKYNAKKLNVNFEITRNELNIDLVKSKYSFLYENKKAPFDLKTLEQKTFEYTKEIGKVLKWDLDDEKKRFLQKIGSFELSFYYLKHISSTKESYPFKEINPKERKSVLDKFGGMKIYRDSFRVRPYGDKGNDWLDLGSSRTASPAGAGQRIGDWRVALKSTAGAVKISRKTNPLLVDKSDRGALQENESFKGFKRIIQRIIHEFEDDRSKILNVYYLYNQEEKERKFNLLIQQKAEELANKIILEKEIENTKSNHSKEKEKKLFEEAFKDTFQQIENEELKKEYSEIVQVRALASLGLIVSSFAHELKEIRDNASEINLLQKIYFELASTETKKTESYKDGIDIIKLLKADSNKIKHWVDYSLTAIKKDKRKRKPLDFAIYFNSLKTNWGKVFKDRNITCFVENNFNHDNYKFRAFEMDMNTIFTNLINNSIDSFERHTEIIDRHISIKIRKVDDYIEIIYSDNGVGISEVFEEKEEIYLPFTTSKKDRLGKIIGTGLGMYLVKNVIDDNNGRIEILNPKVGFCVAITFPLRKG